MPFKVGKRQDCNQAVSENYSNATQSGFWDRSFHKASVSLVLYKNAAETNDPIWVKVNTTVIMIGLVEVGSPNMCFARAC